MRRRAGYCAETRSKEGAAGALTAQHYAASFADGVRRLVLVAPAGRMGREVDSTEVAAFRARRADEPWYRPAAEAAELLATGVSGVAAEEAQRRSAPFLYGRWTDETRAHHEADRVRPPAWLYEAIYRGKPAEHATEERLRSCVGGSPGADAGRRRGLRAVPGRPR
ncbi:MAG: hypothetical protein HOY79_14530 [Streptomyces sp.]|nr:hypothetical protein [Streptomyces sp.]